MLNEINPQRRRHFTCQRQISRAQRISQIRLRIYFVKKYLAVCEIFFWRHHPDLNWGWGFCRPLPYLLAMMPYRIEWCRYFVWSGRRCGRLRGNLAVRTRFACLRFHRTSLCEANPVNWFLNPQDFSIHTVLLCVERETGFGPATFTLARWHSTTESLPHTIALTIYQTKSNFATFFCKFAILFGLFFSTAQRRGKIG